METGRRYGRSSTTNGTFPNVLTDPVWSERVSPVSWAGPKRRRPPGIRFEDLPPIHAVLVSHDHYDHLDLPTLRRLAQAHRPRIFTGLGNGAFLTSKKIAGTLELDWWQSAELGRTVSVTAVPVRHFSGRGLFDRNKTLWCGFVLEGAAGTVFFAGDTGDGPHFEEIARRFPGIRLAILPIGAYLPRWFMSEVHIDPEEALRAHAALNAGTSIGVHFGTFEIADDGQDEPVETLLNLLAKAVPKPRFWILDFGEGREVPPSVLKPSG